MTTSQSTSLPRADSDRRDRTRLRLAGDWTLANADALSRVVRAIPRQVRTIDASGVTALDSLGALALVHFTKKRNLPREAIQFDASQAALIEAVAKVSDDRPEPKPELGVRAALERLGRGVADNAHEITALVSFLGETLIKMLRMVRHPRRIRPKSVVSHMEQVGLDAVPLVLLLNFLVGAVVAFLGANVLRDFGATIFVVELVNISFLREFAVLLTAIVLAGRTASAFTAQIGAMMSREEVDAMRTMGIDPVDALVIPRLWALVIMLPLLTFLAMIAGLAGGVTVGAVALDIPVQAYLARMERTIAVRHFLVGMSKAPLFALVIALIGCLEGLQVEGTAQSVGERTTSSVVQAISLVIVLDALLAMWFMYMDF